MNKFQPFIFQSVEECLDYLPKEERLVMDFLRYIIIDSIPQCREKLAYNVPFYYRHSRICFLWPASVPWGNVKMNGVQFGFCNGNLLNDELNYLEKGSRKQVYSKNFHSIHEIDVDLVKTYLFEAMQTDEHLHNLRTK